MVDVKQVSCHVISLHVCSPRCNHYNTVGMWSDSMHTRSFVYKHYHFIIQRFESSDWSKEGHMTWIIFDNVYVWKLIHVSYFFYYFPNSRRNCHICRICKSIACFPDFTVRYGLKKNLWMGCIIQILTALLFGEWWKIIIPSVKFNLGLLFTEASVKSRPRLNFTSGTKFSTIPLMSSQYSYTIFHVTQCLLFMIRCIATYLFYLHHAWLIHTVKELFTSNHILPAWLQCSTHVSRVIVSDVVNAICSMRSLIESTKHPWWMTSGNK